MPELPEVETTVRYLAPRIRGKRIVKVVTDTPRLFRDYKSPADVIRKIEGVKIKDVSRRGKNIVFHLSHNGYFLVHLMMSGRLWFNPRAASPYDRLTMYVSGGDKIVLNDARKFGRCRLVSSLGDITGQEPLNMSFTEFKDAFLRRKGAIKPLLLNQRVVAGIGNIYADEMLWYAGIHPLRRASEVGSQEARKLWEAMQTVLRRAIKANGSSMRYFQTPDGEEGRYYRIRKVYRRTGEPCDRDGALIQRIIVGQRNAHFCPKHQK